MSDGNSIYDEAAELAFPRYPGSDGDARAIELLEERTRTIGLETSLQWFTYDLGPAQRALRLTLISSAVLVAAAGFLTARSPLFGLALLAAAVIPGVVFLAWTPWLDRMELVRAG